MVSNQLFQEKHPAQRVENSLNSMERNIKLWKWFKQAKVFAMTLPQMETAFSRLT